MNPKFDPESNRFFRGGTWYSTGFSALASSRGGYRPGFRNNLVGFRLCRAVPFTPDNSTPTRRSADVQED